MCDTNRWHRALPAAGKMIVLGAALAGCGSTSRVPSSPKSAAGSGTGPTMQMGASSGSGSGMSVNGIKPIPMRQLAATT